MRVSDLMRCGWWAAKVGGEHGAQRMANKNGGIGRDSCEVVDVLLDGEGDEDGAALEGFDDVEVAGEIGDGAWSAGFAIDQDDGGGTGMTVGVDLYGFKFYWGLNRRRAARGWTPYCERYLGRPANAAGVEGFEPSLLGPEPSVLPLDHTPIGFRENLTQGR